MSESVSKIDGFGTRRNLSGTEVTNFEERKRFARFFAAEAISKGDVVAIDVATNTYGYGNSVKKANSGTNAVSCPIGVATSDIANGKIGEIQVGGLCDFAKILDTNDDPGDLLGSSGTAGSLTIMAADDILPCAILVVEGTANTADSTVFLLNPANL